jgi:spore cortex formation protein SpoVR/YcgB (stage V sporulation)
MKKPGSEDVNRQIRVFNIALFAPADQSAINGVSPRREPCISGYEFYYDDLDVVVSFRHNNRVFRITTRNKKTSMFGIAPGDSFLQAKEKITQLGFTQSYTPHKFVRDWCLFTLLVDEKNNVFGMTVEILD